METRYQVQVNAFEGPLDLLLQLIEKEKFSISEISLAAVTDQFIAYMESRERVPLEELSNFLSIAAKLILIKSRALLPTLTFTESEEDSLMDLQMQLELYALFQEVARKLKNQFAAQKGFVIRDTYLGLEQVYAPPEGINSDILKHSFQNFLGGLEQEKEVLPTETLQKIISLEERISEIQSSIHKKGMVSFSKLLQSDAPKEEKIVSFLALLELVKQKLIYVEQDAHFAEMNIHPKNI